MASMKRAFDPIPPLVWAAGHDHNLQVIHLPGPGRTWNLISGAGGGKRYLMPVRSIGGTVFRKKAPGYMRLVFPRDGPATLEVIAVTASGKTTTIFATPLE
jgi:hypothetical protein